eukprot:356607-Chlamydomonas_euryale.AAC.3
MLGWKLQLSSCHLVRLAVHAMHVAPALHLASHQCARTNTTTDAHAAADVHVVAMDATADASESSRWGSDRVTRGSDFDEPEGSDAGDEGHVAELGRACDA